MSTSRLQIYNDALLLCGERALSSLTENRENRHLLDQVWNNDGILACLEEAQWNFAMRTIQIDYDPDYAPSFGYEHAFTKPTDWVLTSGICCDEYFTTPLLRYFDESGYWFSDLDTIFVRYVSNDENYGMNLAVWPRSFTEFVAAHFASKLVSKITNDEARLQKVYKLREKLLMQAKNKTAMADPTKFEAQGNWTKSRMRGSRRRDGGNTGSNGNLIG